MVKGFRKHLQVCRAFVPKVFRQWQAPQLVAIDDIRIALAYWALRIAVISYVFTTLLWDVNKQDISYVSWQDEVPTGRPTFKFDKGGWPSAKGKFSDLGYCKKKDINHLSPDGGYNDDKDMICSFPSYASAVSVTGEGAFLTTYAKQLHTKTVACEDASVACEVISGLQGNYTHENDNVNSKCTCSKLTNTFYAGVEDMTLAIQPAFSTTAIMAPAGYDSVQGSSTTTKAQASEALKPLKICIKKFDADKGKCGLDKIEGEEYWRLCCVEKLEKPGSASFPVKDWLSWAGVVLDERTTGDNGRVEAGTDGKQPIFRITGAVLTFQINFYGNIESDHALCEIVVKSNEEWTSSGSTDTWVTYGGAEGDVPEEYFNNWKRGLRIRFETGGTFFKFSIPKLVNGIIGGVVLLGVCEMVTKVVAVLLLPESTIYSKVLREEFVYSQALARFGIDAALTCQVFRTWDKGGEGSVSKQELAHVFRGYLDPLAAQQVAEVIIEAAHGKDGETELSFVQLTDLMSTGLVSMPALAKYAQRNADDVEEDDKKPPETLLGRAEQGKPPREAQKNAKGRTPRGSSRGESAPRTRSKESSDTRRGSKEPLRGGSNGARGRRRDSE
jgi:hypothetical protein